jgi:hypothetical protein
MFSKRQPIGKFIKSVLVKKFSDYPWSASMPVWKVNSILDQEYRGEFVVNYISSGKLALYERE